MAVFEQLGIRGLRRVPRLPWARPRDHKAGRSNLV